MAESSSMERSDTQSRLEYQINQLLIRKPFLSFEKSLKVLYPFGHDREEGIVGLKRIKNLDHSKRSSRFQFLENFKS